MVADVTTHAATYVLALGIFGLLLWHRRRMLQRLAAVGSVARHGATDHYGPTTEATVLTVCVAALTPFVVWVVARRLGQVTSGELGFAVSRGLTAVAATWAPLEVVRQAARPDGLMTAHFAWTVHPVALLRHHLRWFVPVALPLVFLFVVMFSQGDLGYQGSLGRIALVLLLGIFGVLTHRVLHPRHGIFRKLLATQPAGWLNRTRGIWYGGAIAAPLVLAGVALAGYVYTASQLVERALGTVWLAVSLMVAHGLMIRWVLVNRRSLAMQHRRDRLRVEAQVDAAEPPAGVSPPAEPLPNLAVLDAQTRRLVSTATVASACLGMWVIWSGMIPALGVLDRVTLWTLAGAEPGTTQPFTLEDLALALVLAVITAVVAKNVPALIEMSLLQRLPLHAGLRYAITTMTRYALGFIGLAIIVGVLGVTWNSVQWMVAAFGVGLGFGLQEIFANFVSGIILLFERPVRVGDTVTIGDTTGTVTHIRMRATTVLDWDMKELVVPNKDLVTGRLVNWTLSDAQSRITVAVGVAYGSDVEQVTRVLRDIVRGNPRVLVVPEPSITFEAFGDSALTFRIRAHLASLEDRLPATHALHAEIARRLALEGIEIAFPQLDVHVRSDGAPDALADVTRFSVER